MLTAKKPPGSENSLPGAVLFQPQSGFHGVEEIGLVGQSNNCLLYTSDAVDDTPCVDLGGCLTIKYTIVDPFTLSFLFLTVHILPLVSRV
ncbi:hypothetical protein KX265_00645, partial [Escherichia coli]